MSGTTHSSTLSEVTGPQRAWMTTGNTVIAANLVAAKPVQDLKSEAEVDEALEDLNRQLADGRLGPAMLGPQFNDLWNAKCVWLGKEPPIMSKNQRSSTRRGSTRAYAVTQGASDVTTIDEIKQPETPNETAARG